MFVHENVQGQPFSLFQSMFGEAYHLFDLEVNPAMFGFGLLSRDRRYVLGFHKTRTRLLADPLVLLGRVSSQLSLWTTCPAHCCFAALEEVLEEARRIAGMRSFELPPHIAHRTSLQNMDLAEMLSPRERHALAHYTWKYEERWGRDPARDPNAVFSLGTTDTLIVHGRA